MSEKIDGTGNATINNIRMAQQIGHPASPASGYDVLYIISGSPHGGLYLKDPAGRQIGPFITGSASSSSGISPGQVISYPSSFTGDTINGSSATPFVDVAAFDTKEVLNSRILHLQTTGASKDHKVRVTLGSAKAAAFDVRVCLGTNMAAWSAAGDVYVDVLLKTSGDALLSSARIATTTNGIASAEDRHTIIRFGGNGAVATSNYVPSFPDVNGQAFTLRFVRDGSNVISYYASIGNIPMFLGQIITVATNTPYTNTVSGTLERIEIASHSPAGPSAGQNYIDIYVDYLSSV